MNPRDIEPNKSGRKARSVVHYKMNPENWEYREEIGSDVGRDCIIELIENNQWLNNKIEGQIKGTKNINYIFNSEYISFPLETKTINYADNSPYSFILYLVDLNNENLYFTCIQEYLRNNIISQEKRNSQKTINIRIKVKSIVTNGDELVVYAKNRWIK